MLSQLYQSIGKLLGILGINQQCVLAGFQQFPKDGQLTRHDSFA